MGSPSQDLSPRGPPLQARKQKGGGPSSTVRSHEKGSSIERTSSPLAYHSDLDTISEDGDLEPDRPRVYKTRAGTLLIKQPSVVHERRELEEEAEVAEKSRAQRPRDQVPAVQSRRNQDASRGNGKRGKRGSPLPVMPSESTGRVGTTQHMRSASQPAPISTTTTSGSRTSFERSDKTVGTASGTPPQAKGRGIRPQSLSPTRYAHFAKTPSSAPLAIKHEPPPRSLSPAKSAMRKSPSPRPGSAASQASNVGFTGSVYRNSEAADASQFAEAVNSNLASLHKKRGSRVSFDDEPVVVTENESSLPGAPVRSAQQPGGLAAERKGDSAPQATQDPQLERIAILGPHPGEDDFLTPRPALPSFGSVRRRKGTRENDLSARSLQLLSTPADVRQVSLEASSDQMIGGILAQQTGLQKSGSADGINSGGADQPIPADVTIKKPSDLEAWSLHNPSRQVSHLGVVAGEDTPDLSASHRLQADNVGRGLDNEDTVLPSIEFTQPTPNLEKLEPGLEWSGAGNTEAADSRSLAIGGTRDDVVQAKFPSTTPALAGVAEPEPDEAARNHGRSSPVVGHVADGLRLQTEGEPIEEVDDTDGEHYSDAAENIAQTEGDGFGSIDAVVDSPTVDSTPGVAITTPPESPTQTKEGTKKPTVSRATEKQPDDGRAGNWDQTQSYRNEVNERQKRELVRDERGVIAPGFGQSTKPKTKKKKPVLALGRANEGTVKVPGVPQQPLAVPATKPRLRQQVSSSNGSVNPQIQQSPVRATGQHGRQNSLPATSVVTTAAWRGQVGAPRSASVSHSPTSNQNGVSEAVRNELRNVGTARAVPPPPTRGTTRTTAPASNGKGWPMSSPLKRNDSNSSASSSSFKKSRPRSSSGAAVSLRRTMRSDPPPAARSAVESSRFSVRSLSPTGSTRRPMRTSLRGSQGGGNVPSLRSMSADQAKKPSSFRGSRKGLKTGGGKANKAGPSRFGRTSRRRFSDSSDDDVDMPRPRVRGRYDDSSDDDDVNDEIVPASFAPVRGIPRRIGEEDEDSSQLANSSDEGARVEDDKRKKTTRDGKQGSRTLAMGTLRQSGAGVRPSGATAALTAPHPPPTTSSQVHEGRLRGGKDKKRRSFFTMLGRNKDKSSKIGKDKDMGTTATTPTLRPAELNGFTSTNITGGGSNTGRAAAGGSATTRPSSSRRTLSKAEGTPTIESWPIPSSSSRPTPPSSVKEARRPSTSDGVVSSSYRFPWGLGSKSNRLVMGDRRTSNPAVLPSRAGSVNAPGPDGPNGMYGTVGGQVEGGGAGGIGLIPEEKEDEAIDEGGDSIVRTRDAKNEEKRMVSGVGGSSGGGGEGGGETATGRNGKKKKFSRLRRAFGLHD